MSAAAVESAGIPRLAWAKARIELRMTFTSPKDLFGLSIWVIMLVAAAFSQWEHRGTLLLGSMAFMPAASAMLTLPSVIAMDKTDGTILRRKTLPRGVQAYVLSRIVYGSVVSVFLVVVVLAIALGTGAALPAGWADVVSAVAIALIGGMALTPLGVALGAILPNPREAVALISFPFMFLAAFSGVFLPTTSFPGWLKDATEVFPLAWMVQGSQDAFTGSLRSFPAWIFLLVCALWLTAGSFCAVPLTRAMVRKQTGSALAARRSKATAA
jgi:ABC-2 type transport system permease protein